MTGHRNSIHSYAQQNACFHTKFSVGPPFDGAIGLVVAEIAILVVLEGAAQ